MRSEIRLSDRIIHFNEFSMNNELTNIRFLEQDQFRAIIDTVEDKHALFKPWLSLCLRTYRATGARPAEIVGKNARQRRSQEEGVADVSATQEHHGLRVCDLRGNYQVLLEGKNTVGGIKLGLGLKPRLALVGDREVYKELVELAAAAKTRTAHIFGLGPSNKLHYDGYMELRNDVRKLRPYLDASLQDFQVRWLRHSWAVHALRNSVDLVTIQRQLGHTMLEVTAGYLRFAPTDSAKVLSAFSAAKPQEPVETTRAHSCPSCGFDWHEDHEGRLVLDSRVGVALRRRPLGRMHA